ncbi:hypothetical protein [Cystobacter fuscus]|uniref:hypothetical protein n=1 Tax=Cystobacter fuscus TaxID=43 RepID=UPI0005B8E110|nr:hypothetical protein [Cystobacter fuscus]
MFTFGQRILRSFVSLMSGWGCALLAYVATLAVRGEVSEVGAVAAWTLAFALIGWGVVGLPLVRFIDVRSRIFQAWWGPLLGATVAFCTFLFLAGRWFKPGTMEFNLFSGFAAITGGVAWRVYAMLGRIRSEVPPNSQPQ